jgi:hypothetical protein
MPENEPLAPRGCPDPRLWQVAGELLAAHDAEQCMVCREGGPCTVIAAAVAARERAMDAAPRRAVGRARVRPPGRGRGPRR